MRRPRFGGKAGNLDRGRSTHGAKWVFITPADEMLNYAQIKTQHAELMAAGIGMTVKWQKFLTAKKTAGWELFKSQKEAKRFLVLRRQQAAGLVRNLARQVKQPLNVRRPDGLEQTIGHYIADFTYEEREDEDYAWRPVVEETKGYEEDLYIWKKKHFEAQYGIALRQS